MPERKRVRVSETRASRLAGLFGLVLCASCWPLAATAQKLHEKVPVLKLERTPSGPPVILYDDPNTSRDDRQPKLPSNPNELRYVTPDGKKEALNVGRSDSMTIDGRTEREGILNYHAVFNPAVIPFKRNEAFDTVIGDSQLAVADRRLTRLPLLGNRRIPGRELFWGSIQVQFKRGQYLPIPSVSPDSNILTVATTPRVTVTFHKDSADNFYAKAEHDGLVRLTYLMDARSRYFSAALPPRARDDQVPAKLVRPLSRVLQRRAEALWARIGVSRTMSYSERVARLVRYFAASRRARCPSR